MKGGAQDSTRNIERVVVIRSRGVPPGKGNRTQ
jgi:hypothetical protein